MKILTLVRNLFFCLALALLINPQISLMAEVLVSETVEAQDLSMPEGDVIVETDAVTTKEVSESTLPPASITIGGRFSADDNMGMLDVLVPVVGNDSCFLFIDPRVAIADESENEQNIGLGVRKLVMDEKLIVGGNVFYDSRETSYDNRYNQFGAGLELLTQWVDARINGYWPGDDRNVIGTYEDSDTSVSSQDVWDMDPRFKKNRVEQWGYRETISTVTTHHFDKFEEAMDGFDCEVGVKLPYISKWAETRIFGGYYHYNSSFGDDIKGFKGRLEIRALPILILDAEVFENDELHGTDYYVGARMHVPFDFGNIFQGKNPFEGVGELFKNREPRTMKERMTEMVIRDTDVITEESDFIEDPNKLTVDTTKEYNKIHRTLRDDITHVDKDYTGAIQDGTFEHPFTSFTLGLAAAFGNMWVYLHNASTPYVGNFTLREGTKLWGSGHETFDIESGVNPVIESGGSGPTLTLEGDNLVKGVTLSNPSSPAIFGENVSQVYIHSNILEGNANEESVGIQFDFTIAGFFTGIVIENNTIEGYDLEGIDINNMGGGTVSGITISDNEITNNGISGIAFQNYQDGTIANIAILNNTIESNGWNVEYEDNPEGGIFIENGSGEDPDPTGCLITGISIIGNTILNNGSTEPGRGNNGIRLVNGDDSNVMNNVLIAYNQISGNTSNGISIANWGEGPEEISTMSNFSFIGNTISNNGHDGNYADIGSINNGIGIFNAYYGVMSNFVFSGNTITGNGGDDSWLEFAGFGNVNNGIGIFSGFPLFLEYLPKYQLLTNFTFTDNIISNNGGDEAMIESFFDMSSGNINNGIGIFSVGSTTSNFTVSGNTISNNGGYGVYLGADAFFGSSSMTGGNINNGIGIIFLTATVSGISIIDNTITGNGGGGVFVETANTMEDDDDDYILTNIGNGIGVINMDSVVSDFAVSGNTISENMNYYIGVEVGNDDDDDFIANPVDIFANIGNGIGVINVDTDMSRFTATGNTVTDNFNYYIGVAIPFCGDSDNIYVGAAFTNIANGIGIVNVNSMLSDVTVSANVFSDNRTFLVGVGYENYVFGGNLTIEKIFANINNGIGIVNAYDSTMSGFSAANNTIVDNQGYMIFAATNNYQDDDDDYVDAYMNVNNGVAMINNESMATGFALLDNTITGNGGAGVSIASPFDFGYDDDDDLYSGTIAANVSNGVGIINFMAEASEFAFSGNLISDNGVHSDDDDDFYFPGDFQGVSIASITNLDVGPSPESSRISVDDVLVNTCNGIGIINVMTDASAFTVSGNTITENGGYMIGIASVFREEETSASGEVSVDSVVANACNGVAVINAYATLSDFSVIDNTISSNGGAFIGVGVSTNGDDDDFNEVNAFQVSANLNNGLGMINAYAEVIDVTVSANTITENGGFILGVAHAYGSGNVVSVESVVGANVANGIGISNGLDTTASNVVITGNTITENGGENIAIGYSGYYPDDDDDNEAYANVGNGIGIINALDSTSTGFVVSGNTISGNGAFGVYIGVNADDDDDVDELVVANVNNGIGIINVEGLDTVSGFTIEGNTITENGSDGVFIAYSNGYYYSGGNVNNGIGMFNVHSATMTDITISGNTITDNGGDFSAISYGSTNNGIGIFNGRDSTIDDITILNNTITGNGGVGDIDEEGALSNGIGITTLDATTSNLTISGNTISENDTNGISFYNNFRTGYSVLSGNIITANGLSGIFIVNGHTMQNLTFENNTIDSNSEHGMLVENYGTMRDITITGNSASNNVQRGMVFDNYDRLGWFELTSNVVTGNGGFGVGFRNNGGIIMNIDMGNGWNSSDGINSFYGNGSYDFDNRSNTTIMAEYNWWGQDADPLTNGQINNQGGGTSTDYTPWLSSDPN